MTRIGRDAVGSHLRSGFLEGLTPPERKVVIAAASLRRFVGHSIVTHQETPADRLFLLTSGRARYFFLTPDGRKVHLFALLPGDTFGGAALLSRPSNSHVSAETVKDSCVLMWDRNTIRARCEVSKTAGERAVNGVRLLGMVCCYSSGSNLPERSRQARLRLVQSGPWHWSAGPARPGIGYDESGTRSSGKSHRVHR